MRWFLLFLLSCKHAEIPSAPDVAPPPIIVDSGVDAFEASIDAGSLDAMRAEDWEIGAGKWTFENGEASCECTSGSVIYWKNDRPKDFAAAIDIFFLTVESSAGLVFREAGGTFYQFEWYTRGTHHDRRLSLMVKNPYWVQIVDPLEREPSIGKWIRYRVRAEGDHIETFIDGERVFDKTDRSYLREGRIGIHVFQPRKIRLKAFRVRRAGD